MVTFLETENVNRAYGRGIAFYVNEPCSEKCNDILFHVFCNQSSHRCECLPDFPVNVEDTVCAKALSLGQRCEYDASCKFLDKYSECAKEEQRCRCIHNYMPKVNLRKGKKFGRGIYSLPDYHDLLTLLIIILLSLLLIILTFIAYKLCKKNSTLNVHSLGRRRSKLTDDNQFERNEDAASPFVLLDEQHSKPESVASSDSNLSKTIKNLDPPLPPFRSVSMRSMLDAVPSMHCNNSLNFLQRRPSLSSIQSSFRSYRSYSSFRSNSPYRNFKQIFTNFKRSNNVRSTSDNLCESILVKQPDAFQPVPDAKYDQHPPYGHCNGQRPVRTTPSRTADNKLTENKRQQHLLNNHLHHTHHLTKDLNSHYHLHHHHPNHHSNHQLNHHLAHHYGKEFIRPVICSTAGTPAMAAVSTQTINAPTLDPPLMPSLTSALNPNSSLNAQAAAAAAAANTAPANPSGANFLLRTGASVASNQSNNVANNILANSVMHNNNVLKKCTKINDEKFSS